MVFYLSKMSLGSINHFQSIFFLHLHIHCSPDLFYSNAEPTPPASQLIKTNYHVGT